MKTGRIFIALIVLAVYFLSMFKPILPLAEYVMNKDYIATVLCINQDKPELACEGKCHLKKRIVEEEQSDNEEQNVLEVRLLSFHLPIIECCKLNVLTDNPIHKFLFCLNYDFSETYDIFHPPRA